MSTYQRALLIVNPVAGHARGLRLGQQLKDSLEARGVVCSVRVTNGQGDARRWSLAAAADGFDLLVAIGGDGTVAEVVAGQTRSPVKVPIAIVPVGTANVVSLALALPWLPGMALSTVLEGRVLPFDVGYLPDHDRHFFLMAALGFPARVIRDSPRRLKNLFGVFTYLGAGLRNAFHLGDVRILIEADGQVHEFAGSTILLSNIGKIGDINLKVTPDTSAHDGRFDVSVISSRSLWDLLGVLVRMLTWRQRPHSRLHHLQAQRVVITTEPPVGVQIDGEDLGQTPLTAEIVPNGVHLVVGNRYRENPDGGGFLKEFQMPWLKPRRVGAGGPGTDRTA
jgi:diacylglycerol kinase (ATP)